MDLSTAFLVVQEMIALWPKIISHISATGQLQEVQNVEGRECISCVFTVSLLVFVGILHVKFA